MDRHSIYVLIAVIGGVLLVPTSLGCPPECKCMPSNGGVLSTCTSGHLQTIPRGIPSSTTELYMMNQNLTVLDSDSFAELGNLRMLLISRCGIEQIKPDTFTNLGRLHKLDLRRNKIRELHSYTFTGLFQLRELKLDNNELESIRSFAFHGLNLSSLGLEKNYPLNKVSEKAFKEAHTSSLSLFNSSLSGESLTALRPLRASLRELSIQNNRRPLRIPHDVFEGFNLKSLKLTNNGITETDFLEYVKTDSLFLEDNPTGVINFSQYPNLNQMRYLYLTNSGYSSVLPSHFSPSTLLLQLHLADNGITTLPEGLRPLFSKLERLTLEGNPFHCNCEMIWFKQWIAATAINNIGVSCSSPLEGSIETAEEKKMLCAAPKKATILPTINITRPDDVFLTCSAKADPAPTIYWLSQDGDILQTDEAPSSRKVLESVALLHLSATTHENISTVTCVAYNVAGNVSDAMDVVLYKPQNTSSSAERSDVVNWLAFLTVYIIIKTFNISHVQ